MGRTESKVDTSVCQSGRKSCYQARDEYYQCVDTNSDTKGGEKACKGLREKFEKSCKKSWVKHFDAARDKELEVLRTLKKNINQSTRNGAVGGLAGRDQRSS